MDATPETLFEDQRMNLGGPSKETCRKQQANYTSKSGVMKDWFKTFLKLFSSQYSCDVQPLIYNDFLRVTQCVLANNSIS